MERTIDELEKELKLIINRNKVSLDDIKEKEIQTAFLSEKELRKKEIEQGKIKCKPFCKPIVNRFVNPSSKKKINDRIVIDELNAGLRPIDIAKKYNKSRQLVNKYLKRLRSRNLILKTKKGYDVNPIVNRISYTMTEKDSDIQLQTIQVQVPLLKPELLDMLKWDTINESLNQKFLKLKWFKVTIKKTTKSIILLLHERWIEDINQIPDIIEGYLDFLEEELKKYDIYIDKKKVRTYGMHLWRRDRNIGNNYEKKDGIIKVSHGRQVKKLFKYDKPKESVSWIDSTPSPDGEETNDIRVVSNRKLLEEYMKAPTIFTNSLNTASKLMNELSMNILSHKSLVEIMKDQSLIQTKNMENQTGVIKEIKEFMVNINDQLIKPSDVIGKVDLNDIRPNDQLVCPRCHKYSYAKAIVKKNFHCLYCFFDLKLEYPYLVQNKEIFKPKLD